MFESLKAKGARFVERLDAVPPGARRVFRAHGVARAVEEEEAARGLPVLDAKCPLVSNVHSQGQRYVQQGRTVVPIGHAGHPEAEGTMGRIPGHVHLVQTETDVAELEIPPHAPVASISQTTLSVDDTKEIITALKRRCVDIGGPETRDICYATQNRQSAVRELSRLVDVLLVVGAKNSFYSNRLREVDAEARIPAFLIADKSDLDFSASRDAGTIGVTAGASAPEILVTEVLEALSVLGPIEMATLPGVAENIEFKLPAELGD